MAYPDYIRAAAVRMRTERDLSIDEIAERLAVPRTTVYYWVRDLPLQKSRESWKLGQIRAAEATRLKHQKLREEAYALGREQWDKLEGEPTFREFVALYIAEGSKRDRNRVSIGNSDPTVIAVAASWLKRLSDHTLQYSIQYHADQDLDELRAFWAAVLSIDETRIKLQRKSNSNQLTGRIWRSRHGVLTVCASDTYLRSRLQAWMDQIRLRWTLDSASASGV